MDIIILYIILNMTNSFNVSPSMAGKEWNSSEQCQNTE